MTFEQIIKDLRKKSYYPIYFLQGEEAFFIDKIADYIEGKVLTASEKSFNQTILYGKDTDIPTIMNNARRYPMMAPYQVVIVKEAQQLRDINKILSYVEKPLNSTILVLLYKYKKLRSNSKLAKAIKKQGVFFTAKKLYPRDVPKWVHAYLKKRGYTINQNAMTLLTEYLGTNLSKITNELSKLMLNVSRGTLIREQHIADNIGISKDYNSFELQKALGQRATDKVFKIVYYFAANPKSAPFPLIISSLYNYFNKLFRYHYAKSQGEAAILQALGLNNRYFLKEYQTAGRNFTLAQVKRNILLLHEYDLKFKGVNNVSVPEGELLKEMVIRMLV